MMTKKKNESPNYMNRWLFLVLWILTTYAHILTWIGTFVVTQNIIKPSWIAIVSSILLTALLSGAILAFPQKWLLKKAFGLDIPRWRRGSVAAWGCGGLSWFIVGLIMFMSTTSISRNSPIPNLFFYLFWFGPLILVQYSLLEQNRHHAERYLLANLVSVIVLGQFIEIRSLDELSFWQIVIPGTLQGAITGLTLLWLHSKHLANPKIIW